MTTYQPSLEYFILRDIAINKTRNTTKHKDTIRKQHNRILITFQHSMDQDKCLFKVEIFNKR